MELKGVMIRYVTPNLLARIAAAAQEAGVSQQELLLDLLTATYAEPPAVVGWLRFDRRGDIDADAPCPACGQPLTEVWAALLTNGAWLAPRCQWCATSE